MSSRTPVRSVVALVTLLAGSGTIHLVRPRTYERIVPESVPGSAHAWVLASGVGEIAVAAALANPRTRALGGTLAALLFVAVFPANVKMARDALASSRATTARKAIAVVRLPLQVPLVTMALRARRA